ncbi:hypothetical protein E4T99_05880 [Neisseria sp. WF04]|nr:hypothetical protein E4T99_05880 [Neisseria sp. WF04]
MADQLKLPLRRFDVPHQTIACTSCTIVYLLYFRYSIAAPCRVVCIGCGLLPDIGNRRARHITVVIPPHKQAGSRHAQQNNERP